MEVSTQASKRSETIKRSIQGKSNMKRVKRKKYLFVYLMLIPAVINFAIFYVGVNLNSFVMAFQFMQVGENGVYYIFSFANFERLFKELAIVTTDVHVGLLNTFKYFASQLLITLPLTYLMSYFLYKKMWGYKFFRVIFFLPSIIPAMVYVMTFKTVIEPYGPLSAVWESLFGVKWPAFATDPNTATGTIIFFTIWTGFGVNLLLYQGAMGRVPEEVLEAGKLDGVGWVREMFQIITPMIWPTLSTTIILALSRIFTATGPILLFADTSGVGDTAGSSTTLSYFIFSQSYGSSSLEYPAAISVFFTIISFPLVIFVRWIFGKLDPEVEY